MDEHAEPKLWWRKVGRGSLRIGETIIQPNERFQAAESEIPAAFRDTLKLVDRGELIRTTMPPARTLEVQRREEGMRLIEEDVDSTEEEKSPLILPPSRNARGDSSDEELELEEEEDDVDLDDTDEYHAVEKSSGWYDVVSTVTGKPINEKRLRKKEAEELLEALI
jgi:hypothetical protein